MHVIVALGSYNRSMSAHADTHQSNTVDLPRAITSELLDALRGYGVTKAFLFGSVARGEERPDSDIDLHVQFDHDITLFEQIDIAEDLAKICGRKVDLVLNIHPVFEPYIVPTLVPLPL
ncbi:MAG: nucleotidyltransferase family protein [Thermomicrobiales bacterium]|nr:nucleotidyltransferase family protein [Thermomicrobiales bacterium]